LFSGKGVLAEFWYILRQQSIKYEKLPLLIAKQNNRATLVFSETKLYPFEYPAFSIPPLKIHAVPFDYFLASDPKMMFDT
jgi:hypothetical protein